MSIYTVGPSKVERCSYFDPARCNFLSYMNGEQMGLLGFVPLGPKADWVTGSGNAFMRTSKGAIRHRLFSTPVGHRDT